MGEVHQNQNNEDIISKNALTNQDLVLDEENSNTDYFKLKWLTTTLRFIKDNEWHILKYPEMSRDMMDFVDTLITYISSDVELKPLLASIREALTIYQLKFEFTFKLSKKNGAVQLVYTKHEKGKINENKNDTNIKSNSKSENGCVESEKPLIPAGGFKNRVVREKVKIISDVPMKYVLDSLQRIVDFLKDVGSASIVFEDVNMKQWIFLMNVKSLLKNRAVLVNHLTAQINELLKEIATHENHDFNLSLNGRNFKNKRSVTVQKTPKFPQHIVRREKKNKKLKKKKQSLDISQDSTSSNSSSGEKLLKAISFSGKDEDFKRPPSVDQSLSSSVESLNVSISSNSDRRQVSIERRSISESVPSINFKSGGILDYHAVETSSQKKGSQAKKKKQKIKERGRSDKRLGPMKTKLIEAMSVPLESTKGLRMMLRMGWKGGALGARGTGITEPIMPDLQTVTGAGLGHKQKCRPEKPKKKPKTYSGDGSQNDTNNSSKPSYENTMLDPVTRTRLEILQGILELVESFDEKRSFYFNRKLIDREINFLEPAIESFNARSVPDIFEHEAELVMVEDVTEAMKGNLESRLHVKISSDRRLIEVTKTSDNITFDEPIYNDRFVRCNKDLDESYAEKSILSDYREKVSSQLSVDKFMSTMEPMESYNVKTKKRYRAKAFKMMVLGEILDFLEGQELNRIFYIETEIFKSDVTIVRKYIEKVNARRKDGFLSTPEESMDERILSKMGDCCLTLDYNQNQQLMRISKVFSRNPSSKPTASTPIHTNNDKPIEDVENNSTTEQNKDLQNEVDTDKVLNNQEPQIVVSDDDTHEKIEGSSENIEKGMKEINDQVSSDGEIDNDKMTKVESNTLNRNIDLSNMSINDQLLSNVDIDDVIQISNDTSNRNEYYCDKSLTLLKDIENLERSIMNRHKDYQIEPCSSKLISERKNSAIKNTNKPKSYKTIGIMYSETNVKLDLNMIKEVQNLLSDAIGQCKNELPLLQYHGTIKNRLVYTCFNEHTYLWIKVVLCGKFIVSDININPKDVYRLQIKLNSFNDDIEDVLDKIFLYNPDLDGTTWFIVKEVVNDNFTLIDIEVNGDSLEYINQNDYSLFAGVDKVQFTIVD